MQQLNFSSIDPSWQNAVTQGLSKLNPDYIQFLQEDANWLPGHEKIFNAFSLPRAQVKYVLFGESPYPRQKSANGYAFWDNAVQEIWSEKGLSKPVNRATSLRNFIKMLLRTKHLLREDNTSQTAIANVPKQGLIQHIEQLFTNMMDSGFLLLNTSLVLSNRPVRYDAKQWFAFVEEILTSLSQEKHPICLILFGNVAHSLKKMPILQHFEHFLCEHPYNISFIENQVVHNFFKPFDLLKCKS